MFKIGDVVVYPNVGVARIADIRKEKIGNSYQKCYILETQIQTANQPPMIKLPVDKVEANRLRGIVDEKEGDKVFEVLKKRGGKPDSQTWNRRHREYQEKMRSGSIYLAAEVYRDLCLLKETKDLSHGERRLFDQAKNLLIKELSIAKKIDEKDIELAINKIFRQPEPSPSDKDDTDN